MGNGIAERQLAPPSPSPGLSPRPSGHTLADKKTRRLRHRGTSSGSSMTLIERGLTELFGNERNSPGAFLVCQRGPLLHKTRNLSTRGRSRPCEGLARI